MVHKIFYFIFFFNAYLLLSGCKKSDKTIYPAPGAFTASISERDDTYAVISWTKSTAFDGSPVTYMVTINGQAVAINLSDTTYRVTGLTGDNGYQGSVIAKDARGHTATANFSIGETQGYIFFTRWDDRQYHCYTIAGDPKWQINKELSAAPAVSHDTIFARGYTEACALNIHNGTVIWSIPLSGIDNMLYDRGRLYTTVSNNQIIALDASTGKQLWAYQGAVAYGITLSSGILLAEHSTVQGGELLAIDAANGTLKWRITTPSVAGLPLGKNGLIYFQYEPADNSSDNTKSNFDAYDIQTGQLRWHTTYTGVLSAANGARPAVVGNRVYFVGHQNFNDNLTTLYALTAANGSFNWQAPIASGGLSFSLAGHEKGIYATSSYSSACYDPANGNFLGVIGTLPGSFAITNKSYISALGYTNLIPRDYFGVYDFQFNHVFSRLQKIEPFGAFLVLGNDGKIYYPVNNPMYTVN